MNQQELTQALMAAFLEELHEHIAALNSNLLALEKSPDPAQRKEVLQHHLRAEKFWQERVAKANVR